MPDQSRVVVAMSGGVDSSVAAALLKSQGHDVIGMMLRLWSEPDQDSDNRCCTPDAMAVARRVAARLSIPFYAVDAQQVFYDTVVRSFRHGYAQNITPNPCLVCNRSIRWGFLLQRALDLGATHLATGHYAQVFQDETGLFQLKRGLDPAKDQSYVLHILDQAQLKYTLFPIGGYTKPQVRELARQFNLPAAERPESQDLCFLGSSDYRDFLIRQDPHLQNPGPMRTRSGDVLGQHNGLAFYTIGQRKGLGISSPRPLYVLEKDAASNTLVIGYEEELGSQDLVAIQMHWIAGTPPPMPFRAQVKIRYKARAEDATMHFLTDHSVHIRFDVPLRDITPGQAVVIFQDDLCLGGGIIST